jgi:hypothetical protein
MTTTPYLHYDQVFVILRMDPTASREGALESGVGLLKALWSQAAAEEEVARLNQPHRDQHAVYFWKAARLERRVAQASVP